ncbi:uncharacterized protein TNCV_4336201 [Trichonephila clavipes]|nr:uncharacterized protein TNCV_4336201 [Trichonephila clavipes]
MVWGVILYYGRSNLLRIEGSLNSSRYVRVVLQPEVAQGIPGGNGSQVMHTHIQRLFETSVQPNACNFFLDQLIHRICRLLSTYGIELISASLVIRVLQLPKTNFCCAYK